MIKIQIFRQSEGYVTGFEVKGHSNIADYGQDIVCAAVSALAQTALLGLGQYLHRDVDYRVKRADMYTVLKDEPDDLTDAILETMVLGLKEIEKIYPKSIHILEHRR
jgi:hypothetical protein